MLQLNGSRHDTLGAARLDKFKKSTNNDLCLLPIYTVHVRLESAKAVNVHKPMLDAYLFADAVEVVSELYITVVLNFCFCWQTERHAFSHIYIQQLVLLIYRLVINNKNESIWSSNWPHNFKQLPVLKMLYFNITCPVTWVFWYDK